MKMPTRPFLAFLSSAVVMFGQSAPAPTPSQPPSEVPEAKAVPPSPDPLTTRAVPYRPTMNREPFASPTEDTDKGKGDMVDDIGVKGYTRKGGKYFAVVSDKRGSIRELPVGYKFRDGEIASIDEKGVTFRQWDVNSTVRTAFRTIVKSFKREEGKR